MDLLTLLWVAAIVVSGLALETYGVLSGRGTITASVRKAAQAYPPIIGIVSLVLGSLWAHLFWQ